ncbi:MAG TPA: peptidoglycan DD-metalloendopeptidase family protein [Stellaceae bacterium]|nr:peptidoglycan DD-metalloendopeptidase family protein [Stellaceae bacterium]
MPRPDRFPTLLSPLIVAAIAVFGVLDVGLARADDTPQSQLESVQKQLEQSKQQQQTLAQQSAALAREIEQLRAQQVAAAQSVQAHESALSRLEAQRTKLTLDIKAKGAELDKRRGEQQAVLAALLHLARNPPIGLALADGTPIDLLRGGILMGAAVPPLVDRAQRLGAELRTMNDLQDQLRNAEAQHRIETDVLGKEQTQLAALASQKSVLQRQAAQGAAASAQEVQRLASQASDLKDLIERAEAAERAREEREARAAAARHKREAEAARLAAAAAAVPPPADHAGRSNPAEQPAAAAAPALSDPARPPKIRPFAQAQGKMVVPAAGEMVAGFGDSSSKGVTFATRPGAEVVAPFDGRVVFAGAFRGYGQILIIGHGDGYHSLVAGLDRIDSSVGQWLVAGEPIGRMSANEAEPRLYLELRHNGQPINPLPWLATRDAKVKG